MPEEGAVIDQKLSELLDVGPGDTLTVDGDTRAEITVAAVTEHYLGHFIYLSPSYYETVFGEDYRESAFLLRASWRARKAERASACLSL